MSYFGKEYTLVKSENFEGLLKSFGLSDKEVQAITEAKLTQTVVKNGEAYTHKTDSNEGPKETSFKSGVEFDDVFGAEKAPIKNLYVVDGNTVTQTMKDDKGETVIKNEYNGNDLLVTITRSTWNGVAKLYYKAN